MGLMSSLPEQEQDRRPKDWAYKIAFNRKDLPSLQEIARHIRESHDTDMIEDINRRCEEKLAGQTAVLGNGIGIEAVTKTEDLVVNVGLQQCINIILGNAVRWTRFGFTKNSGSNPPAVTNTTLDSSGGGPWYVSMDTYGWQEAKGMKLFFGTITPQNINDPNFSQATVNEMGISNPNLVLLNRELFFNNPINRFSSNAQVYNQTFMFSSVIEFCPVA